MTTKWGHETDRERKVRLRVEAEKRQEVFNKLSTEEKIARNPKRAEHYTKQAAQAATLAKLAKKEKPAPNARA